MSSLSASQPKTRNNMIQIFRALSIIAVVMIHTTPSGVWQVFCRPFINFSVATFLFLSGYLTKIENDNWYVFLQKRIIRVIIPYIIWTILYTVLSTVLSGGNLSRIPYNLITARATGTMTDALFHYHLGINLFLSRSKSDDPLIFNLKGSYLTGHTAKLCTVKFYFIFIFIFLKTCI